MYTSPIYFTEDTYSFLHIAGMLISIVLAAYTVKYNFNPVKKEFEDIFTNIKPNFYSNETMLIALNKYKDQETDRIHEEITKKVQRK